VDGSTKRSQRENRKAEEEEEDINITRKG